MAQMSNLALRRLLRQLNRKWFCSRLPGDFKVEFSNIRDLAECYLDNEGQKYVGIRVSNRIRFSHKLVEMCLLHEVAHAILPPSCDHCEHWMCVMRKLAEWGAMDGLW